MHRCLSVPITVFVAVLAVQASHIGWAQDSDRAERYFDDLDRNDDGQLDSDEFRRLDGKWRDRFKDKGIDGDRSVSKSRFIDTYRRIDEERRREDDGRRDGSSSSSSDRDRGRSSSRRKERTKLTASLPSKYAAFDKNKDDQIGMYEWDRAKFAEFVALDRNGDGFLTPNELDDPAKPTATATTAVAKTGSPSTTGSSGTPTVNAAMSPDKPAVAEDPVTKQAKYFFTVILDKDKNGEVTEQEWAAVRGVKTMFDNAKVTLTLPMKEAYFVEQYVAIKKK